MQDREDRFVPAPVPPSHVACEGDEPDLWSARQNADLFETEFTRRVVPVATEVV